MPGLFKAINFFKKHGLKMAVVSSASRDYLDNILKRINLKDEFTVIVSGEEVERGKPHPDINLYCAQKLNIDPRNFLVLEDSPSGVEAAKRAMMQAVAIPSQHTKNNDFSAADYVLKSLLDVPKIFRKRS